MIQFEYPFRLPSLANQRFAHWRVRHREMRRHKDVLGHAWRYYVIAARSKALPPFPVRVTFTRIAPRPLDDDNLAISFKAKRDKLAELLGLRSDNGPEVQWCYAQRKGAPRYYGVEVTIEEVSK
jgi:hypothetical protein